MSEFFVCSGIVIDSIENVVREMEKLSGAKLRNQEVIRQFITTEKHTRFYVDDKMRTSMAPSGESIFLWLDTGFRDRSGKPIFVSLHRSAEGYRGHITGTARKLVESLKVGVGSKKLATIQENFGRFLSKYESKVSERVHVCITSKDEYQGAATQGSPGETEFARLMRLAKVEEYLENENTGENENHLTETAESEMEQSEAEILPALDEREQKMTLDILLDKIDEMENYIGKLLGIIKSREQQTNSQIEKLQKENESYKKTLLDMRIYKEKEEDILARQEAVKAERTSFMKGHNMLPHGKKILVLGNANIRDEDMRAIAKQFGFEKNDLEFETDYTKVKHFTGRGQTKERYAAIVLGQCPHKVQSLGNWSSLVEKLKQWDSEVLVVDARTKSGDLKVTKESYREALRQLLEQVA